MIDSGLSSFRTLKKLSPPDITELPFENATVVLVFEMDEQWPYVGSEKKQRWLFYAWEPGFKKVLAHVFGSRTQQTLEKLLSKLKPFMSKIRIICTDGWEPYATRLPSNKHVAGKLHNQRIERENLNLGIRIKRLVRKTICHSRSEEIDGEVMDEYLYREHYQLIWGKTEQQP